MFLCFLTASSSASASAGPGLGLEDLFLFDLLRSHSFLRGTCAMHWRLCCEFEDLASCGRKDATTTAAKAAAAVGGAAAAGGLGGGGGGQFLPRYPDFGLCFILPYAFNANTIACARSHLSVYRL